MQRDKLKLLPQTPGVYFHKDKTGKIIYIGKAAVLKNRVRQYFQSSKLMDDKTKALVAEIADTDWIETESEIDALFLEAEMVKRYMPRYNVLLRDDKSLTFVRIDMKSEWPHISFTRHPLDDGAEYYGPYYNSFAIKKAMRYLRRVFPHYIKTPNGSKLDLDAHIGLSPVGMTSGEYKTNLRKLIDYIKGGRKRIVDDLVREMQQVSDAHDFEQAAIIRDRIRNLKELQQKIMFGDKEFLNASKDQALSDLTELFKLSKIPVRIEGYDISHISGTDVVASMIVFTNGVSDRAQYRKFKIRIDRNDDYHNMSEVIKRRLSDKNMKDWGRPDLVLIDGGKGQLEAAIKERDNSGRSIIPFIGLAKRNEQIVIMDEMRHLLDNNKLSELDGSLSVTDSFGLIDLPNNSHIVKLLQRIRDESHRFAISYHTALKTSKQKGSLLDDIQGVGPRTKTKLIRKFGSVKAIRSASESDIASLIGIQKARKVINGLSE